MDGFVNNPIENISDFLQQIKDLQSELSKEKITRQKAESKLNAILNSIVDAIVSIDENGTIISYNRGAENIFGYKTEEMIGKSISLLMPEDFRPKHEAGMLRYIQSGKAKVLGSCVEVAGLHKDGKTIPIELTIGEIRDVVERQFIGIIRDITKRKKAEQHIKHMALHDQLTGLPNRNMFNIHLERAMNRAKRNSSDLALMYIDLDNFKPVNDQFGHIAGDAVLKEIALRFKSSVRTTDIVARFGGDEFVAILEVINGRENAANLARRYLQAANEPLNFNGHKLHVGASVGISIFPDDGNSPEDLLSAADSAMYKAKKSGHNSYQFFNS